MELKQRYVCAAKCPELDREDDPCPHCTTDDPEHAFETQDGCPCGNKPDWKPISHDWSKTALK